MGVLSGWFLAGLAAISAPIIFHMIRRTPSGRVPFSATMFLEASPPRITRRSRIDHWPLLLLRGLALGLLAVAFARPFFRDKATGTTPVTPGRHIAVLIDTSASMQRVGMWEDARKEVLKALASATDGDRFALYAFDKDVRRIFRFDEWTTLQPATRREIINERLDALQPTWAATNLGAALVTAAEDIESLEMDTDDRSGRRPAASVLVISDIQQGSAVEELQNYDWPSDTGVAVVQLSPLIEANAGLELMASDSDANADKVRLRVSNAAGSDAEQFAVRWQDEIGEPLGEAEPVYVAPGQSRTIAIDPPADTGATARAVLSGDAHEFDNTVFVDQQRQDTLSVLYLGEESADDPEGLHFYLKPAFPRTPLRTVTVLPPRTNSAPTPVDPSISLIVVADKIETGRLTELREFLNGGGSVLFVAQTTDGASTVGPLLSDEPLTPVEEADVSGYAMISDVDFSHPVFAPLSDAQFADFTRIHIWKHRVLPGAVLTDARVLARFDSGDPALIERSIGRGHLFVLATGWHPRDSQLALSSKFVPLMNGLLEYGTGQTSVLPRLIVGDPLDLSSFSADGSEDAEFVIERPDGSQHRLPPASKQFTDTDLPGVYALKAGSLSARFAVNVAASESNTAPMPTEQLEQFGVKMDNAVGDPVDLAALAARERQLKIEELERRQKVWRWLVVVALAALFLETWLAGRLARRRMARQSAAAQGGTA